MSIAANAQFPYKNIAWITAGDLFARMLNFLAFIYLARTLGVAAYGVVELAIAILTYFQIIADFGVEQWAIRSVAQGKPVTELVSQIVPLRVMMAGVSFILLLFLLPLMPDVTGLEKLLVLFGTILFAQAINLKWTSMGKERMPIVAVGLILGQVVFSLAVFAFIRGPITVFWVPVIRLVSEISMVVYFCWVFLHGSPPKLLKFNLTELPSVLKEAAPIGLSNGLGLMGYNLDLILIGYMLSSMAVGWYSAAYKPVTILLSFPAAYYSGLFPALSRQFSENLSAFRASVSKSLHLTALFALPAGIGLYFLADPVIMLIYGENYRLSIPALQILSWSLILVILRGNFRQALNAAGAQHLDLIAAGVAITINLCLNLVLIPRFGIRGAATATLVSEIVWLGMLAAIYSNRISSIDYIKALLHPVLASLAMAGWMLVSEGLLWLIQAVAGGLIYFVVLVISGESEIRLWLKQIHILQ